MAMQITGNTTEHARRRSAMIAMNIVAAIGVSLIMFVSSVQSQTPSDEGAIRIMRNSSQALRQAPAEHFTGPCVSIPYFRRLRRRQPRGES
jgi:hypothetical protein